MIWRAGQRVTTFMNSSGLLEIVGVRVGLDMIHPSH